MSHRLKQPLAGGDAIDVVTLKLAHHPVHNEQYAGESTTTAVQSFGAIAGASFGVWEMSQGRMHDVEAEEIFVITAGHGTVQIAEFEGNPQCEVELYPGVLMRLSAGMKTTWTVTEALRKVYITPNEGN